MKFIHVDFIVKTEIIGFGRKPNKVYSTANLRDDLKFNDFEILELFSELDEEFRVTSKSTSEEISDCKVVNDVSLHYVKKTGF